MTPSELHYNLTEAVRTMPEFNVAASNVPLTSEQIRWQASALVLMELQDNLLDASSFRSAMSSSIHGLLRANAGMTFYQLLATAIARLELQLPSGIRGAFIPIGNQFDALRAISEIVRSAEQDLFIVDPYADDSALVRFAINVGEGIRTRIFRDGQYRDCGARLRSAGDAWQQQYGAARPLEIRSAPNRTLHDRFIAIDSTKVYLVSQSFKDLAARSPATIQRAEQSLADEKLHAFEELWQTAALL